uniref:CRC domain-containing protein n=1 Tax=Ditylenchus dipsaci TaxID=166011 RepID=A0A915E3Z2_9BILA
MDHHQDEEVIAHEEILEEGQMGEAGAEYYEEEYIEVDEAGVEGGQLIDSKGNIYVEGEHEIVGDLDPGTYIGVDGGTIVAGDQYMDEEAQLGDGQIVRVVRSNNRQQQQQQQYPVHYIQHQGVAYPARRFPQGRQPGYGMPPRQYHVQPISQNSANQGRIAQRQPTHSIGYQQQQQYPLKRVYGQQYADRGEYSMGTSDGKIKGYYDPDMQDVKSQVLRPANALINISNSSMGSPMLSALPYQQRGSAGGPTRDPLTGSVIPSYLTGSGSKQTKPRKSSSKKKPCNCTKSMCLKLYCDCFANGEFCLDCNCKDCHNNLDHEAERSRAIKSSLERNPTAFKPKITVSTKAGRQADMERLHQKGCHCKNQTA